MKTYRLLVSRRYHQHTDYPSMEEVKRIEDGLAEDQFTMFFKFQASTPNEAGAITRTILWCEGATLNDMCNGKVFAKLQEKHATEPFTWTNLGSWDHFGVGFNRGR